MKNQALVYVLVAVISLAAGVAIAGAPESVAVPATITTIVEPTTTTTEPAATTTAVPTTEPEVAATEPEVATTETTTSTTTTEPAPDPADIVVVAVNGAGTQGLASDVRDQLVFFGYTQARATDGTTLVDETAIYYFDGFEAEAAEIARFLEIDPETIRPIAEAPEFATLDGDQVAVYLGRDRT